MVNFSGYMQHAAKSSTCHQDKNVNGIFIPDQMHLKVFHPQDKHASRRLYFYPG